MANWLVSAHGNIEHKRARKTKNNRTKQIVTIPTGMDVVLYCPDNRQLTMSGGWRLWDMLMYGEHGGETSAYAARYSRRRANTTISNYFAYIDNSDIDPWIDGSGGPRANTHPTKSAYGVWRVGDASAPMIDLTLQPDQSVRLGDILTAAKADGAARVYWGCCRAHILHFGQANERNTTKSDLPPYTPSGLI